MEPTPNGTEIDTEARALARKVLAEYGVYVDAAGVPPIADVVKLLVNKLGKEINLEIGKNYKFRVRDYTLIQGTLLQETGHWVNLGHPIETFEGRGPENPSSDIWLNLDWVVAISLE